MKYFNFPRAAAGVIALAAALGLVRHEREAERKAPVRINVVVRDSTNSTTDSSGKPRPFAIDSETGQIYFAEFTRNKAEGTHNGATGYIPRRPSLEA